MGEQQFEEVCKVDARGFGRAFTEFTTSERETW
jgi:hypothetical protein